MTKGEMNALLKAAGSIVSDMDDRSGICKWHPDHQDYGIAEWYEQTYRVPFEFLLLYLSELTRARSP